MCVFLEIPPSGQGWCWDTGTWRWAACADSSGPGRTPSTTLARLFIQPTWHLLLGQAWAQGPLPPPGSESPAWEGEPPCQAAGKQDAGQGPGPTWPC